MYRAWKIRIREEKEMRQREMEHEERQELFEDENL